MQTLFFAKFLDYRLNGIIIKNVDTLCLETILMLFLLLETMVCLLLNICASKIKKAVTT